MPMKKAALTALLLLGPCFAQNSSVEGRVTNAAGDPLKGVLVILAKSAPSALTVETGADGSFVFRDVAPGRYNLQVQRVGYVSTPGSTVTVVAGERMTGSAFKMTRAALIVGRVLDPDGDPVPNAVVNVQVDDMGDIESATSRADGSFVIGGLKAGAYYLRATERPEPAAYGREISGPKEAFVPTYYPGATDESKATLVRVEAGAELRDLDIHMRKARVFQVVGKVVTADTGAPVGNTGVRMMEDNAGTSSSQITPDGSFEFLRVPPGKYTISEYQTSQNKTISVGHLAVTIANGDVEGLVLKVGPGLEISGHIRIDGTSAASRMSLDLRTATRRWTDSRTNRDNGVVAGDGSFVFHDIDPDVYTVTIRNQPAGTYIKSMRFGDEDVTGKTLDLTGLTLAGAAGKTLDILLSPHAAEVTGTVRDSQGVARPGVEVRLWASGDIVGWDQTDQNGTFHLVNLAPGDYRIAASEEYPEDVTKSEQGGAVKLKEDSREKIDLPLIPMPKPATR
jgi:protocatechuate 3,4-dioxygenase beta subunit